MAGDASVPSPSHVDPRPYGWLWMGGTSAGDGCVPRECFDGEKCCCKDGGEEEWKGQHEGGGVASSQVKAARDQAEGGGGTGAVDDGCAGGKKRWQGGEPLYALQCRVVPDQRDKHKRGGGEDAEGGEDEQG